MLGLRQLCRTPTSTASRQLLQPLLPARTTKFHRRKAHHQHRANEEPVSDVVGAFQRHNSRGCKRWALAFSFAAIGVLDETKEKQSKREKSSGCVKNEKKVEVKAPKEEPCIHERARHAGDNPDPAFVLFDHDVPDYDGLKWEKLYTDPKHTVHRRWRNDQQTYEYRCCGSYDDISGKNFVAAQMDNDYRKKWDPHVIELDVVETRSDDVEVVRWLHRFPRPLNPRVYIYSRVYRWESDTVYVVENRVLNEDSHPTSHKDKSYVRVETYSSTLRVRPHKSFEETGLDYVLIYYDHPKAVIPGPAYNWMVSKGGPYFLSYVHDAARKLAQEEEFENSLASSATGNDKPTSG